MAQRVDFNIKGAAEMEALLKQLGPEVASKVGVQALRAAAKPIVAEAKRLVPVSEVDHKHLRDSIVIRTVRNVKFVEGKGLRTAGMSHVVIGFEKPAAGRAHLIEFGTVHQAAQPFMRPALDNQVGAALDEMGKVLARGITREAKKLAKPIR